ncbi:hypothetical protein DV515_00002282 [Chloebia gouldiae]|uniref:Phospholipase A2 n=1 Tax=Chloebia gouldiae TaxID=44316 RepID=A0A3L8SW87_CHLGU|nr:hypothetical protein DV515_00002282 [Chloebia gouldiae]
MMYWGSREAKKSLSPESFICYDLLMMQQSLAAFSNPLPVNCEPCQFQWQRISCVWTGAGVLPQQWCHSCVKDFGEGSVRIQLPTIRKWDGRRVTGFKKPVREAGRCEIALPQITLDVCVNVTTMDQDGILSQELITQTCQQGDRTMQLNPDEKQWTSLTKIESSLCYLLTVRIIRARNIHQADVSIKNCKDPVWNETFYFRIQSQVKNVLELALYDKDVVTQDDHLFTVYFDIAKLSLGEEVFMHFKCDSQRQEELEVGFALDNISGPPETIITNGVLVSRKICCLEVQVVEKKKKKKEKKSKKEFSFKVQGSYEGTQDIVLGSDLVFCSSSPAKFHYTRYKQPMLDVTLPGKKLPSSSNSRVCDTGFPNVELHSIPSGKNMILAEDKRFDLYAKAEDCPDHLDVRLGFDLCIQEQDFLCKRKNYVIPALKKVLQLEQDLLDHETPVVAIMTTGGGMRSLTALYGSLRGLKKLNVLDCATYLTGLSGTTWTMSNLYRDADWSRKDLDKQISEARKQMTKCKINSFSLEYLKYYKKQLCQRKREGRKTSFIDLWGLVLESFLHDGVQYIIKQHLLWLTIF